MSTEAKAQKSTATSNGPRVSSSRTTPASGSESLDLLQRQQARLTRPKGTFQERVKAKEEEADRIRALEHANSALLQELAEARLRAPIKKDTGSSSKRARAHDDDGSDGSDDDDDERRPRKAQKTRDEDFVPNSDDDDDDDKENALPEGKEVIEIGSSQEEEIPKPRKTRAGKAVAVDKNAGAGKATKAKVTRKTAGKEKAAGAVAAVPDKPEAHIGEEEVDAEAGPSKPAKTAKGKGKGRAAVVKRKAKTPATEELASALADPEYAVAMDKWCKGQGELPVGPPSAARLFLKAQEQTAIGKERNQLLAKLVGQCDILCAAHQLDPALSGLLARVFVVAFL